jgi:hypothetical protein
MQSQELTFTMDLHSAKFVQCLNSLMKYSCHGPAGFFRGIGRFSLSAAPITRTSNCGGCCYYYCHHLRLTSSESSACIGYMHLSVDTISNSEGGGRGRVENRSENQLELAVSGLVQLVPLSNTMVSPASRHLNSRCAVRPSPASRYIYPFSVWHMNTYMYYALTEAN